GALRPSGSGGDNQCAQLDAGDIGDVPGAASLLDGAGVEQPAKVGAGGGGGDVGLLAVAAAVGAAEQALLQSDHDPVRPATALGQLLESLPAEGRLFHPRQAPSRLRQVGIEAK